MACFTCVMAFAVDITNRAELQSFLETAGTNSGVIAANLDLSDEGEQFVVAGTKDLTINEGVTLSLKSAFADKAVEAPVEATYESEENRNGFCFRVPNGAKLTIKGDGTIAADRSIIFVEDGGELTIGESSKASQLKMTTNEGRVKNRILVVKEGTAYLYNAKLTGRSGVVWNSGTIKVDGGIYKGQSSSSDNTTNTPGFIGGSQYTYLFNSRGTAVLKNASFLGCHGGVSPEEGGKMEIDGCILKTDPANGAYEGIANNYTYYGLYVCTYAIATVRNSEIYSTDKYPVYIGNNDTKHTFGLVYLYENCLLRGSTDCKNYPYIQKKSHTDADMLLPIEIDKSSDWYTIATTGSNCTDHKFPLPVGYAYKEIIESGEPTADQVVDAVAYAKGYRLKVVSTTPAAQQEAASVDPSATIPWQQETTWTGDVPAATDVVTIPEGKVVVVKKNEATTDVAAAQVQIQGEGASLTVEDGTSLKIGQSLNMTPGAKLVVEAGAMVTVGEGGVVAADDDAIEVKTQEGKTGIFMIAPGVKENTHPMAKVQLVSKAKYIPAENKYVWQRFGIPAYMAGMTKANVEYDHVANPTAWMKIEHENWSDFENTDEFKPFTCYGLTTTATTEGAVYTFTCPLMGNGNAELDLADNWNYYANSYTAPINIRQLLKDFNTKYPSVSATVYLYRAYDNWWYELNNGAYAFGVDENNQPLPEQIDPMQAFIFQRKNDGDNPVINYEDNVWGPIVTPSAYAGAPARDRKSYNKAMIEIATADGTKDAIRLIEDDQFSSAFDNSYDAAKYMNENSFNLFAEVNDEKMGIIASDNLDGTMISMTTKGQTSFTMTISHVSGMNYAVRDMLTGTEIDMVEGATYMFSVPADAKVEGRFQIIEKANAPTAIDNIEATAAVKGIYTITGQFVGNDYHSLPNGIYVVDGKKIVK